MVKAHKLRPTTTDLKAANRSPIPLLGETTVRAMWNCRTIWLKGVVTEHMDEVILGFTWLLEQRAVWNVRTGQLTIEGETHLLLDEVDAAICRRLVVQEQVVIPVRSQMDVQTKTVYSNMKATRDTGGASSTTESEEAAHGLQVARTLVLKRLLEVAVRLMNVSDPPVTWEKCAAVSILEQLNVMAPMTPDTKTTPSSTFKTDLLAAVDGDFVASNRRVRRRVSEG